MVGDTYKAKKGRYVLCSPETSGGVPETLVLQLEVEARDPDTDKGGFAVTGYGFYGAEQKEYERRAVFESCTLLGDAIRSLKGQVRRYKRMGFQEVVDDLGACGRVVPACALAQGPLAATSGGMALSGACEPRWAW